MRIAIREQLVALVLVVALIALAVVSISTWITNQSFVLYIRASRLSLTASLKASELATTLAMMLNVVQLTSTRLRLQNFLTDFGNGTVPDASLVADATSDVNSAIVRYQGSLLGVQAAVFAVNRTSNQYERVLVAEGEVIDNFPPSLYPNFTLSSNQSWYNDHTFNDRSSLLLGPVILNQTFAMVSISLPILDRNDPQQTNILGWLTVSMSAGPIFSVLNSLEGLGNTGTTLLLGPDTPDNRFETGILYNSNLPDVSTDSSSATDPLIRYMLPPTEIQYDEKRHHAHDFASGDAPFPLSAYPAAQKVVTQDMHSINNAGSWLSTTNEQGFAVGTGYALPNTTLVNWIVIVEWARSEVYEPITHLRNVLLACVFGTAGGLLLIVWPLAHFSIRPIRRLREATLNTVESDDSETAERKPRSSISVVEVSSSRSGIPSVMQTNPTSSKPGLFDGLKSFGFAKSRKPVESSGTGTFRIPSKVKQRKHFVEDELTELSGTFNEMTDELLLQYERLEERVRKRTAELELSKQAAEAANESKTLFIANVSHELKTPLNGILGMCAICMQENDLHKIKQSLGTMYKSGDLLLTLLTDLLTFSKNQAGQELTIDNKIFRLHDISTQLKAIFENQARANQIDFKISYGGRFDSQGHLDDPSSLPHKYGPPGTGKVKHMRCKGDMHRILQVAINLVSNALKFTPTKGSVRLYIRCCADSLQKSPSRKSSQQSFASKMIPQFKLLSSRRGSYTDSNRSASRQLRPESEHILDSAASRTSSSPVNPTDPQPPAEIFWFEFVVEDTGPGIGKELQSRIFEPFVQGDLRLTKKFGGTGLGLSICSQLARLMNGTISVQSELDKGSTFTFRIPMEFVGLGSTNATADRTPDSSRVGSMTDFDVQGTSDLETPTPEETIRRASFALGLEGQPRLLGLSEPFFGKGFPASMSSPDDTPSPKENKLRVLVAEDNQVNQEVVLRMLKLEDVFNVEIAEDGQQALEKVKDSLEKNEPYDLILMDVQMPNLDGRESTRLIREHGFKSPIVALSAFSDEVNQRECIESGMDYFLAKPIKRPALRRVLKTYCPTIQEQEEPSSPKTVPAGHRRSISEPKTLDILDPGEVETAEQKPALPEQVIHEEPHKEAQAVQDAVGLPNSEH